MLNVFHFNIARQTEVMLEQREILCEEWWSIGRRGLQILVLTNYGITTGCHFENLGGGQIVSTYIYVWTHFF